MQSMGKHHERMEQCNAVKRYLGANAIRVRRCWFAVERDDGLVLKGAVTASNQELTAVLHRDHLRVQGHVLGVIEDEAAVDVNACRDQNVQSGRVVTGSSTRNKRAGGKAHSLQDSGKLKS